jgi:hypothetical protein
MNTLCRLLLFVGWWLWSLMAFPFATDGGSALPWLILLLPVVCPLFVCWIWYLIRFPHLWRDKLLRSAWLAMPVGALMLMILGGTNLGVTWRVWLCERTLTDFAEAIRAGDNRVAVPESGKWVGLFFVQRTDGVGTEVRMMTRRDLFNSYGIVYCPDGCPGGWFVGEHLYGPWYRYVDEF